MIKRNHSALGLLRLLLVASVLVPVGLTSALGVVTYRAAYEESLQEAIWTSGVAREHAARVFDTQELVIERVLDLTKGLDDAAIRSSESDLHDGLVRILDGLPQFLSIVVTDRDGRLLLSSTAYPAPPDMSFADRDYFRELKLSPDASMISKVQTSRLDGRVFFGLARSRRDPQGRFNGVINIAISPMLFTAFYGTLVLQEEMQDGGRVLSMMRGDGQILVRYPLSAAPLPEVSRLSPVFGALAANPDNGTYRAHSVVDEASPMRLFAYSRVQGYPLYIISGRSLRSIDAEWRGRMLWYLLWIVPATAVLFVVTRITIRRTVREKRALAQAREEIRRRELAEAALHRAQRLEAVGQLTGGIAHDFNNLLTIIVGNVDMMVRHAADPDRVRRLGGNVLLAAKRVADVTDKLLAFSRRRVVRPEIVDLNHLLGELQTLLGQAVSRIVRIVFDFSDETCPVRIDPGQFESAMINLVVNARDAMVQGGSLTISTVRRDVAEGSFNDAPELAAGRYVAVMVRDSGAGMDAATIAKAFEPFFTTKEVGKGTGLGLSQVYGFAKQAGGHVRIESTPGVGTCVEILLPLSSEEPARERPKAEADGPQRTFRREIVLVVEDEPGLRDMAIESLQDLGYRTLAAADAAQALAMLKDGTPVDLMFSDIVMPGGMDGIMLCREARRLRPDLSIVLTSGFTDSSAGGSIPDDVPLLRKPYVREDLASEVGRMLAGSRRSSI